MDGNSEFADPPRRARRWWLIVVVVALSAAGLIGLVRFVAPGLPRVGEAELAAAMATWRANEVRNYDLTVVIRGRRDDEIHATVRDGRPTSVVRHGRALKEERTWRPWTVPGLFETLEDDLANSAHPREKYNVGEGQVVLRAEFDPQYGFPRRYLHQVFGGPGELSWTVTEFTPR